MTNLEVEVRRNDPTEAIAQKLVHFTSPESGKNLFGGDLESAVKILESLASRIQYKIQKEKSSSNSALYSNQAAEVEVQEILQGALRTSDNLLNPENRFVWEDVSESSRLKLASALVEVLERHGFVLASLMDIEEEEIVETTKEVGKFACSRHHDLNFFVLIHEADP